ncbi:hypothetical protein [Erysipelothrix anatis]|uniref:hypothetical protein n=1 Tax=Erysipelothrix anatis TaxID=2683713 RepID=UPI001357A42A|nr:hypothetical protein [Erysipelothrix anatis]
MKLTKLKISDKVFNRIRIGIIFSFLILLLIETLCQSKNPITVYGLVICSILLALLMTSDDSKRIIAPFIYVSLIVCLIIDVANSRFGFPIAIFAIFEASVQFFPYTLGFISKKFPKFYNRFFVDDLN